MTGPRWPCHYTTDGSTPTASSPVYSAPITVSSTETVNAIAAATGFANSIVATATYTIDPSALPAPTFSQTSSAYTNSTNSITDSASRVTNYYTTDGSTPTLSSTKYTTPIALNSPGTSTFNAIAVKSGSTTSPTANAVYTIRPILTKPTFSVMSGTYTSPQIVTISNVSKSVTIYYTTDGSNPTTSSKVYGTPITVSSSERIKAIAVLAGWTNSQVASASYTIP